MLIYELVVTKCILYISIYLHVKNIKTKASTSDTNCTFKVPQMTVNVYRTLMSYILLNDITGELLRDNFGI